MSVSLSLCVCLCLCLSVCVCVCVSCLCVCTERADGDHEVPKRPGGETYFAVAFLHVQCMVCMHSTFVHMYRVHVCMCVSLAIREV